MCCSEHHDRDRHHSPKHPILPWAIAIASFLLIIGGSYGYLNGDSQPLEPSYSPEDVAKIKPFQVVHQMGVGSPIPFLPTTQSQPQIEVPENFYNFGKIGATEIVRRTFVIRNTGKEDLTISRAYTTCGCTTAEFSSSVIPPGKVALVTVTFDAGFHDTRGHTVKRGVIIENNDPNQPEAEIWIQASVGKN